MDLFYFPALEEEHLSSQSKTRVKSQASGLTGALGVIIWTWRSFHQCDFTDKLVHKLVHKFA